MISQAIIAWVDDVTFAILNKSRLLNEIFPRYFKKHKHNNLAPFLQQISRYGFTNIVDNQWRHSEFKKTYLKSVDNMKGKNGKETSKKRQRSFEDSVPSTAFLGEQLDTANTTLMMPELDTDLSKLRFPRKLHHILEHNE